MRVLVLGGYGLIGLEIVRALGRAGHQVVGFGRSETMGRRLAPDIAWRQGDLRRLLRPDDWAVHLTDIDAVVNAAGALQDGSRDDLRAVHDTAVRALLVACERRGVTRFVQISASGAAAEARTAFLATKAAGDAAVRASGLEWTILKPGLVISAGAYGGTTLLRMLAAFPVMQPIVLGDTRVQSVAGADVAQAVCAVLDGQVAARRDYTLMEDKPHTLADVVRAVRRWSGRDAGAQVTLPRWVGFAMARGADLAGWLGWRSPLRTTALKSLADGVTGDPAGWRAAGGFPLMSLEQTLQALPATAQERVFGRAQLVFPALLLALAGFWLASGLIGVWQWEAAENVLAGRVSAQMAQVFVGAGIALDLAIGVGLLFRRWVRHAAWASIVVSLGYLVAGTWLTPELWADPLGPFVKVFPAIALALAVAALVEER
jgi:uncharacterized protein YbjT (DUF2867 family)